MPVSPKKNGTLNDPDVLVDYVNQIGEGIYITKLNGEFVDANPAFLEILGFSSLDELRKLRVSDVFDPEQLAEAARLLRRDGSIRDFELRLRRPDGDIRWALDSAYMVKDTDSGEVTYRGILRDITIRKRLEGQLLEQSIRDPLTGCFNRRHLHEFERAMGEQPWGCIALDVDHFKHYNDTYGHQAGDDVLVRIARFLLRHMRAEASLVRMGGDEFLALLPNADEMQTEKAAARIQNAAERDAPVPFSMGFASRQFKEDLEETIHRADQNLYEVRTFQRAPNQERRKFN